MTGIWPNLHRYIIRMWERSDYILVTLTLFSRSLHYKYSISEPCVHSISWINRWNLTKLAQIYYWDWGKKWLDFGELDLIFKVTLALWNSNFDRKRLVCKLYLEPSLDVYQTITDTLLGHWKEVIRFLWPLSHFQGHFIIRTKNEHCTKSCVHTISLTNGWNLTKLA